MVEIFSRISNSFVLQSHLLICFCAGNSKPTGIAVDWIAGNLYWTEVDRSLAKPKGRVVVSTTDGRYKRSLVSTSTYPSEYGSKNEQIRYLFADMLVDLDSPTSIAVDPQLGKMFWSDAGESPCIETAWLDGSKRRRLLGDRMRHPAGLTVDYAMDHTLYWVDSKMNTIESIRPDGTNRIVVLKGECIIRRRVVEDDLPVKIFLIYISRQISAIIRYRWTCSKITFIGSPVKPENLSNRINSDEVFPS